MKQAKSILAKAAKTIEINLWQNDSDPDPVESIDEQVVEVEKRNSIVHIKPGSLDENSPKEENAIEADQNLNQQDEVVITEVNDNLSFYLQPKESSQESIQADDDHEQSIEIEVQEKEIKEDFEAKEIQSKYQKVKRDMICRSKEAMYKYPLEVIKEVEFSEYESSTVDGRMCSNVPQSHEDASNTSSSFHSINNFDNLHARIEKPDYNSLPILYIDIKISQDKISRLVLYKNQTPYEAAIDFIVRHNIPLRLRPYLIEKVEWHYDKILKQRYIASRQNSN